ncbi:MAG: flavin reductase family protein [Burkholderiales bacterium]|nr:flavin reductase family protein [Burkholderiales bacterium]
MPASGHDAITIRPSILYFGTPVALITTLDERGAANITPMSSVWALDDRLVLGLSGQSQGCANLLRSGEAVVNLPDPPLHAAIERIARTTGRAPVPDFKRAMGYRHEADKFTLGGFTRAAAQVVAPPRIAECPLQLEARLLHARGATPGPADHAHDPGFIVIELAVVRVHAHPDIVLDGTQHVDTARWSPLLYVFRHYFGTGERRGRNFRAET